MLGAQRLHLLMRFPILISYVNAIALKGISIVKIKNIGIFINNIG
jgi:hypothetical protein